MQTILNVFLLIDLHKCEERFDPTKSQHRNTMAYLEETSIQCIKTEQNLCHYLNNIKEKEYKKLKFVYALNNKLIIFDELQQVAYKIYVINVDQSFSKGDNLVKNIESKYICKIYDIVETYVYLLGKKMLFGLKIIAMELIKENFDSVIIYNLTKERYIKLYGRFNAINSYNLYLKKVIQRTLKQIIEAVIAFHEKGMGIIDIKDGNLMYNIVNGKINIKIIDFDTVKILSSITGREPYTPGYGAPEMALGKNISSSSDIWCIGIIGYKLATGKSFENGVKFFEDEYNDFCKNVPYYVNRMDICNDLRCFLKDCLKVDPSERPTATQLLKYKFIKDYVNE